MDCPLVKAGATVYLPVLMPGALFFLGDGHAAQSDGELSGSGVEVSMNVRFRVGLQKGRTIRWPRGEDDGCIFTIGNARPLDDALRHAVTEMMRWLCEEYALSAVDLGMMLGQAAELCIANMFDPAYTVACRLRKEFLHGRVHTGA